MDENRIEEEIKWVKEALAVVGDDRGIPLHHSDARESNTIKNLIQEQGYRHLVNMTASELRDHKDRLETDLNTVRNGIMYDVDDVATTKTECPQCGSHTYALTDSGTNVDWCPNCRRIES